jgi:hypothetical protein
MMIGQSTLQSPASAGGGDVMSYDRETRNAESGNSRSDTTRPIGPGKRTLTEQLVPPQAQPGAASTATAPRTDAGPVQMQMSRDVMPVGDAGGEGGGAANPATAKPGAGGGPPGGAGVAAPGGGANVAATVVAAAADTEFAFDNSFTPALVAALQANPGLSIDEVLQQLAASPLGRGADNDRGLHHPTIVQYGHMAPSTSEPRDTRKRAVLIANQNYTHIRRLNTPIDEAGNMQSQLASRGYDADVQTDKTAADMTSLWGSLVGAANRGDDLVALYSGHGTPEGLAGIDDDRPPNPRDIFTNNQVSGVVSAATSKGAHIRFVLDSCYSGSAVQVVREVRENELAAVASSAGDHVRVVALTGLRKAKQRLMDACLDRDTTLRQLDGEIQRRRAHAPAATTGGTARDAVLDGLDAAFARVPTAFEIAVDRIWAEYVPLLEIVKRAVGHTQAPPPIADYRTLGAQLNYLDDLWNAVSQPMEHATAAAGTAKPAEKPAVP